MKKYLLSALFLLTHFVFADGPYRPPNLEKDIFDVDKLKIDKISEAALFTGLISVARDFDEEDHEVEYDLRSNALAIAGRLDPESQTFIDTAEQLKQNGRTIGEDNNKSDVSAKIYRGVRVLMRGKDNEANKKCAGYCIDIALRLDPDGRYAKKLKDYQEDTGEVKWDDLFGAPVFNDGFFGQQDRNEFKERRETIPGGKAEGFAATQAGVFGLSVRQLSNGRHAGAASELTATALKAADVEGIEFHIDQKVGNMTGNSLEEIKKLMRVRHEADGRMPSGYRISITFEDKDGLLDGPSAGTAMSIILDSLFTGNKLDDKFAVTGAITAAGKVKPIGGVAGKIRGATNKGCNLVGVPHENIKGVSDILVLDGIEKLMNIQVFSFKTLDGAIKVASKNKPEEVKQTIEDFNKVADLIKTKGEESLKHVKVIALLEDVVKKMPNHESARILLSVAKGTEKKILSLGGSFHQINVHASGLQTSLQKMMFTDEITMSSSEREVIKEAFTELKGVSEKLDPRLKDYNGTMLTVLETLSEGPKDDENSKEFTARFKKLWEASNVERKKLMDNPEIMEELYS